MEVKVDSKITIDGKEYTEQEILALLDVLKNSQLFAWKFYTTIYDYPNNFGTAKTITY